MDLRYRLLNVFSIEGDPFSGNPLCVFEEAGGLDDATMQAWARQFNLSETTFVTGGRPAAGEADVRIFTATFEMPFAGHPTLGTAHVVAQLAGSLDEVALSMPAGRIPVRRTADGWQLQANPGTPRHVEAAASELAAVLGVGSDAVVPEGCSWMDVGVEQLLVQLADVGAVRACDPDVRGMHEHMSSRGRPPHAYVWAWTGPDTIEARLFAASGGALEEDPATGSAASNLGAWLAAQGVRGREVVIAQGAQVGRPSRLVVSIDGDGTVRVAGRVREVGSGIVRA